MTCGRRIQLQTVDVILVATPRPGRRGVFDFDLGLGTFLLGEANEVINQDVLS
jgi:hypothetical protein